MVQQKRRNEDREEEDRLAKKLFGSSAGFPDGFEDNSDDDVEIEGTFRAEKEVSKKPVWQDEDDEVQEAIVDVPLHHKKMHIRKATDAINQKITPKEYEGRLREIFCHSSGAAPAWSRSSFCESKKAQNAHSDDDDLEDALHEMTAFTGKCVTSSKSLTKGVINVKRLDNIIRGHRFGKKPMRALQFHPNRKILMCAGENGLLSLFEVGMPETEETFLQNVRFKAFPITSAFFTADGSKIIVGSNKKSSEYVGVLTASTKIVCVKFFPNDSSIVFALGENGQVFMWNIRKPKEQQTFYDEGSVRGTVIRISENGQYIACGSNTGIVNLYDSADVLKNLSPKPIKVFDNLTTSIDCMTFNTDSQILSVSSSIKNNSIRLIHVGSRTVYTNFPSRDMNLGKVTVTDFSPKSAYMGVGDDRGFLSLFRLSHFTTY
ncbi:unnamed protein product [Onchocerca ochengi]|uniref:WD_REPEATS_REGION domain-containing protein n=1 Tax=Onchocerca ochengi TaxID=42157 RepID=A0A182DXG6_ONCOC|nr:unnamed protein product [Onchocerca ochengi]